MEGIAEVGRAVGSGAAVAEAYLREDHSPEALAALDGSGVEPTILGTGAFDKASVRGPGAEVLAVVADPTRTLEELELGSNPLVLVVEGVEKPGNLGGMLRTADAVGVDAVIVADPTTDVANPNVVRASLGCVFTVPVATAPSEEAISFLVDQKIQIVATLTSATSSHWDADLTGPTALVVGTEHDGLSAGWQEAAKTPVLIPMAGSVDSLNASVSAAVVLYEAARQRSTA